MREQDTVFETTDRLGRWVRCRRSVYQRHLTEHPEMEDYIEEAKLTVGDPDCEYREEADNEEMSIRVYYRMGLGRGQFEKCLIKVPVYYDRTNEGEVATFYFTRRVTEGILLWRRGQG